MNIVDMIIDNAIKQDELDAHRGYCLYWDSDPLEPEFLWGVISNAHIEEGRYQNTLIGEVDGARVEVFSYYPDELYFYASYFIGKTVSEAQQYFTKKDIAYLQS